MIPTTNGCGPRATDERSRLGSQLRFGAFIPPYHALPGNPTLQMRRDLELAEYLDSIGFDEVWFGEHHSAGFEISASPELMIAAAGERTKRIKLGSGVNSAPFHNPLMLADRFNQLDHLTMGRAIMGIGPGQLASDAHLLRLDHGEMRGRMEQALGALVPLLRGQAVDMKTDWFELREAALQLGPFTPGGIEIAVASVYTPTGATIAGKHGLSVLALGAGDKKIQTRLLENWQIHEQTAAAHGQVSSRERWRLAVAMHIAETREQARRDVEYGILNFRHMFAVLSGADPGWKTGAEGVDHWLEKGLGPWGYPVIGTPDDAVKEIERLLDMTDGFGAVLVVCHNCTPWRAQLDSFGLIAEYVMPRFRQVNWARSAGAEWVASRNDMLVPARVNAIEEANKKFGKE